MANSYTKFMDERSQTPQGENLSIAEMAIVYTRFMDATKKKANKLLLEEQQEKLLGIIEVNLGGEEMENHEDITFRSREEVEERNEVEEVEEGGEELVEQVKNEDESNSLESKENNEEVETILDMTSCEFVQEELPSEGIPYILEVEEPIVSFHKIKEASIVNKMIKSFEDKAFKLLIEHNYCLSEND